MSTIVMKLQELEQMVANGCGFVPEDGSEHACGDVNKNGKQCILYSEPRRRCLILGEQLEVTPTMTCIYDVTGDDRFADFPAQELMTPAEVGLTETGGTGATCKRCDFEASGDCRTLTAIVRMMAEWFEVGLLPDYAFAVQPGSCCNFWRRQGVERLVT